MPDNEEITIDEAELIVVAQQRGLNRLMKVILWLLVLLFLITIVMAILGIRLSNTVNNLENKTDDLSAQVESARENVQVANDTVEELLASSPEIIREALFAIFRIEQYLCGGACANEN